MDCGLADHVHCACSPRRRNRESNPRCHPPPHLHSAATTEEIKSSIKVMLPNVGSGYDITGVCRSHISPTSCCQGLLREHALHLLQHRCWRIKIGSGHHVLFSVSAIELLRQLPTSWRHLIDGKLYRNLLRQCTKLSCSRAFSLACAHGMRVKRLPHLSHKAQRAHTATIYSTMCDLIPPPVANSFYCRLSFASR
jgi:hypothetical protein